MGIGSVFLSPLLLLLYPRLPAAAAAADLKKMFTGKIPLAIFFRDL